MYHKWVTIPLFTNKAAEDAYADYVLNETTGASLAVGAVTSCMMAVYLEEDVDDTDRTAQQARMAIRSVSLVILVLAFICLLLRYFFSSRAMLWMRWATFLSVGALIHLRSYFEPTTTLYIRSVAIWSIAMKAVCLMCETSLSRTGSLILLDSLMTMGVEIARPSAGINAPSKWDISALLWFLGAAIMADIQARQGFITKCRLYIARIAAEETGKLYKFLTDNTLDMICVHEMPDGRLKYVSQSAVKIIGWRPSELVGKHLHELLHEDDVCVAEALFADVATSSFEADTAGASARERRAARTQFEAPLLPNADRKAYTASLALSRESIPDDALSKTGEAWAADLAMAVQRRVAADSVASAKIGADVTQTSSNEPTITVNAVSVRSSGRAPTTLLQHVAGSTGATTPMASGSSPTLSEPSRDVSKLSRTAQAASSGYASSEPVQRIFRHLNSTLEQKGGDRPALANHEDIAVGFDKRLKRYGLTNFEETDAPEDCEGMDGSERVPGGAARSGGVATTDSGPLVTAFSLTTDSEPAQSSWMHHYLRMRSKQGGYVQMEMTLNITSQGVVCVYRPV